MNQLLKPRLFSVGPTAVPWNFRIAPLTKPEYHRSSEYYEIFLETRKLLAPLCGTKQLPIILTCSGTGAMEASVVNLCSENDPVIVINAGYFGERWQEICTNYKCKVETFKVNAGESPDLNKLKGFLEQIKNPKCIFFQANETSTAVFLPVDLICNLVRDIHPQCLIVIDAISALGAHQVLMDEWGIDCVVGGSQKAMGVYPGLSFIALSERVKQQTSNRPKYYFDLKKELKHQEAGNACYTSATYLVHQLNHALKTIHGIGLKQFIEHHYVCGLSVRAALQALDLKLFAKGSFSNAVTAFQLPNAIDSKTFLKHVKTKYGCQFAGGQGELTGKIARFGHLGFIDKFDIISGISAIAMSLRDFELQIDFGRAMASMLETFSSSDL